LVKYLQKTTLSEFLGLGQWYIDSGGGAGDNADGGDGDGVGDVKAMLTMKKVVLAIKKTVLAMNMVLLTMNRMFLVMMRVRYCRR
jgi:hypothetical protein